jgi:hypothetical protein
VVHGAQLVLAHHLIGALDQQAQQGRGALRQGDLTTVGGELAAARVEKVRPEA